MIFKPGFSTKDDVNQWSGRGVGLDAVASALTSLNAQLTVQSEANHGTLLTISLPLTVALTSALVVKSGNERYAIAMHSVVECLHCSQADLTTLPNGQIFYRLRSELVPFANMSKLLRIPTLAPQDRFSALLIEGSKGRAVIQVDGIFGERQVVVKNIERNFFRPKFCAAAKQLGDGGVVFILDALEIVDEVGVRSNLSELTHD